MAKAIHTMIRVRELDRSIDFYDRAFGLKVAERLDFDDFTLVYLRNPENDFEIELTWNRDQEGAYTHGSGYGHVALVVEDCAAERERFEQEGFGPRPVSELHRDGALLARFFFVEDPDGYKIEVLERPRAVPVGQSPGPSRKLLEFAQATANEGPALWRRAPFDQRQAPCRFARFGQTHLASPYWAFLADHEFVVRLAASDIQKAFRRVTLDPVRGLVLFMSPARAHERASELARRRHQGICVVPRRRRSLAAVHALEATVGSSPTPDREPDCCFYVGDHANAYLAAERGEGKARRSSSCSTIRRTSSSKWG